MKQNKTLFWMIALLFMIVTAVATSAYDITGTVAYFVMVGLAVYIASESSSLSLLSKIIAIMVLVWALRLGLFLLIRVFRVGEDKRFSEAKKSFFKYIIRIIMKAKSLMKGLI